MRGWFGKPTPLPQRTHGCPPGRPTDPQHRSPPRPARHRPHHGRPRRPEALRLVRWLRTPQHRRIHGAARLPIRPSLRHRCRTRRDRQRPPRRPRLPRTRRTGAHDLRHARRDDHRALAERAVRHQQRRRGPPAHLRHVRTRPRAHRLLLGHYSIDAALGIDGRFNPLVTLLALAIGIVGGLGNAALRRKPGARAGV